MQQADVAAARADHGRALVPAALPDPADLAAPWASELARHSVLPATELRPVLDRVTTQLREAALAERYDPALPAAAGGDLVRARIHQPGCLEIGMELLGAHLEPAADTAARVRRIAAMVAQACTRTLRVKGSIRPSRSASRIKRSGGTGPHWGWVQRARASKPTVTVSSAQRTLG